MASYGSLFRSKDERLQPNLLAVYNKLHSAEIKDSVRQPDPLRDRTSRNIARLYQTGADAVLVKKNIRRTSAAAAINGNIDNSLKAIANNSQGRTNSSNNLGKLAPSNTMGTVSEELVPVRKAKTRSNPRKPDPMNATIALQLHDRSSSGKFFVPEIREPYEAKFEVQPTDQLICQPVIIRCLSISDYH